VSTKEFAPETTRGMPDSATWEDNEERIRLLATIEKGGKQIVEGKIVPHEKVKDRFNPWLTS